MENSVVLLIRNLVMLACLFVVPLLALLGPSVTGFRPPRLLAAESGRASSRPDSDVKERPRGAAQPMGVPHLPPSLSAAGSEPSPRPADVDRERMAVTARSAERGAVRTAVAQVPSDQAIPVQPAHFSPPAAPMRREPPRLAGGGTAGSDNVAWPPPVSAGEVRPSQQPDYLETLTTRLRELGAGYYLLECWGQQQKVYRFYCQMGEAGPQATSFEAVAPDQISAVERVLDQAEAWSVARDRRQTAERPRGQLR
ncbi:MAG: hypothetical protein U0836_24760 [Pirellulales bacterium]